MSDPVVSVIMAAYNGAPLLQQTLTSLSVQTFTDFELVVVDDCSTDSTLGVLRAHRDPRFRVIAAEENVGPVNTRNLAFAHARGRYIAALDQDDLCHPDRLARQVAYLEAHPDTAMVATAAAVIEGEETVPSSLPAVTTPTLLDWLLWIGNPIVWSSVMVRGEMARRLAPFTRPEMLYAEDFDLYHRLRRFGRIARLDEELTLYRRHVGGASQRFIATMAGSAARVLAERHAERFGNEAIERATLIVRHVMGKLAVPDRMALSLVGETLVGLQEHFIATRAPDPESLALIRWETARIWGRICRTGLREGAIGLGDAMATRPDHLGLGYNGIDDLVLARLIGGARALARRYTDQPPQG
jgi:hypothetical protein